MITIEGLGTNLVGAYGNAICPTPHWDALAAQSIVCDNFWMDGTQANDVLESICTGRHRSLHRLDPVIATDATVAFHPWSATGLVTPGLFVTDHPDSLNRVQRRLRGEQRCVSHDSLGPEETEFEHLLTQALEMWMERLESLPWMWIHSKGLSGQWDAPLEYRARMCDEGDPAPPTSRIPPDLWLDKDADPDIAFGWSCGAGAQAIAMDESWVWIDRILREMSLLDHCLVILAGIQGFPLGEHRRIGLGASSSVPSVPPLEGCEPIDAPEEGGESCFAERLHCPLVLRPGTTLPLGWRLPQCIQPHQLPEWVEAWISQDEREEFEDGRSESMVRPSEAQAEGPHVSVAWSEQLRVWNPWSARSTWTASQRSGLAIGSRDVALIVPSWTSRWSWDSAEVSVGTGPGRDANPITEGSFSSADRGLGAHCVSPPWIADRGLLSRVELYVHPEDRWQQNEVGDRASDALQNLLPILNAWVKLHEVGPGELERLLWELDPSLIDPVR